MMLPLRENLLKHWRKLSLRERVIAVLASVSVVVMIWNQAVYSPYQDDIRVLEQELQQTDKKIADMERQFQQQLEATRHDPNREIRSRLVEYQAESTRLDSLLEQTSVQIMKPQAMADMLKDMLQKQTAMKFISLENQPARPEFTEQLDPQNSNNGDAITIYRHSVVLKMQGSYRDTLAYLKQLESLPWRFYWQGIEIESKDYPDALITLEVYTLGFGKGLVGV
jgi:MSHA biogenesis protein MshJ